MSLRFAIAFALLASLAACKEPECLAGSVACDGTCVRLKTDGANCGACGSACAAGAVCSNGTCAATCAAPLATCGQGDQAYCGDTANDPANCGGCGVGCPAGQLCSGGTCAPGCVAPLATCGTGAAAFCTNLANDPANCGGCGEPCADGLVCDGGACAVTCTGAGSLLCAGRCVDAATDVANCGVCGTACVPGTTCAAGACTPTCPSGQMRCGERCVELASDQENCGACGEACPEFGVCTAGACTAVTCRGGFGLPGVPDVVGPLSFTLAPLDVDRDGRLDVVVSPAVDVDTPTSTVQVLRNLGGRRFAPALPLPAGLAVETVRAGDVDGDGLTDLIAGGGGDVTILRGSATGGFQSATPPFALSSSSFADLAVADVSGDGRADVIAALIYVSVRLGAAWGGFEAKAEYGSTAAPFYATSVAVGDVDGDGLPDIVAGQYQGGHFGVYLNLGGGVFAEPVVYFDYWSPVQRLALGDVDGDGDLDVLGAGNGLVVLVNAGDGTLEPPVSYVTGDGDSIAVGDFDGDGHLDAAVGDFGVPRRVDLFRNAGDGTFLSPARFYDLGPWELAAADFDGDWRPDIAVASSVGFGVHLLWNDGGTFLQPALSTAPISFDTLELGDLDGDGDTDAAGFDYPSGSGKVLLGDGAGGFAPGPTFDGTAIAVGDLDGDGDADLVAGVTWWEAGAPALRSYRMDAGALVLVQELAAPAPMALGDVDGDGRLDAIGFRVLMGEDDQVDWLPGRGDGTFGEPQTLGLVDAWGLQALVAGDIDGNGWIDVVAAGYEELLVWRNMGGGSFTFSRAPMAENAYQLALGDLDGDGVPDVAYSSHTPGFVGVLIGDGSGAFTELPHLPYDFPDGVRIGAPAGRARNVLFVYGNVGATVGVAEIDDGGALALLGRWSTAGGSTAFAVGDVDGDLRPDVVMGAYEGIAVRRAACLP